MIKYKCQQCQSECVIVVGQWPNDNDYVVICPECNYEISKDTADKDILIEVCELCRDIVKINHEKNPNNQSQHMLEKLEQVYERTTSWDDSQ